MLGYVVKDNTMGWIRKKSSSSLHIAQDSGFALYSQIDFQIGFFDHLAFKRFRNMDAEVTPLCHNRVGQLE